MAGIILTIDVDDRGTVRVKQFADESKKAFKDMTDGPKQAQGPLDSLKESWIGITAKVAIATAAFYAAKRMLYDTAKQIASATNDIERQAAVLGISTDELQKWQYAAKMSDVNAQEFAIGLKMLSRNMEDASAGAGDTARYFSAMGISVKTTQGHLRPLNDVMGDIMDKFASWEDGPRKIAIAMQLFGRSGETLIPLLNKGKTGFNEFAEEARKLGIIVGKDLVEAGSKMEDQFKRIEARVDSLKMKLVVTVWENFFNIEKQMERMKKEYGERIFVPEIGPPETRFKLPTIPKAPPPGIGEKLKTTEEDPLAAWNALIQKANEWGEVVMGRQDLAELGWTKQEDIVSQVRAELANLERESNEWGEVTVARQELVEAGWTSVAKAEVDAIGEGIKNARLLHQAWLGERTQVSEWEGVWESVGQNISSAWSSNMVNIVRGTESMSQKIKSFFQSIGDVFLSTVSKMITQWVIFGSITGEKKSGGGYGGLLGLISGIGGSSTTAAAGGATSGMEWLSMSGTMMQHGGVVNRPTNAIIGEAGPEAVIPLKGGKIPIEGGRGDTYNTIYIQATDVDSFERRYGGVIESIYFKGKRFNKMALR